MTPSETYAQTVQAAIQLRAVSAALYEASAFCVTGSPLSERIEAMRRNVNRLLLAVESGRAV